MTTLTSFPQRFDVTASVTHGPWDIETVRRTRASQLAQGHISNATSSSKVILGHQQDPEEAVLERLRTAEQAKRRAEAHARIAAKREANPVDSLLALLELPEYQIPVSEQALREILESYPEDE